ncbi:DUF397 domain-containing protein [Sphaerisporangium sp. NPDC051017]|uniref:DUF397 domain-containing protein n=1 Tax=unclassified Sphaerisporangium TaxID=2630420 RepID=UPI0033CFBCC6
MSHSDELKTANWTKSSHSGGSGGDCVEVARLSRGYTGVRDSKNIGPALVLSGEAWATFVAGVKADGLTDA